MTSQERAAAKKIASIMRSARKSQGLTQIDIAQHLGISQSALSKVESAVLIPSAPQWFSFCAKTKISPDSLTLGYVDRFEPVVLDSSIDTLSFRLPKEYSHDRGSKVRTLLPILNFAESVWGEAKLEEFMKIKKVDSDMFVDLDNQINLNFFLDVARELVANGNIKGKETDRVSKCVTEPSCHGELHNKYDGDHTTIDRLKILLSNSNLYEANFNYKIEDLKKDQMTMSIKAEPHMKMFNYRTDAVLGDFLCRYKQSYFQKFTTYGGGRGATLKQVECQFHGADRCVYQLKMAG